MNILKTCKTIMTCLDSTFYCCSPSSRRWELVAWPSPRFRHVFSFCIRPKLRSAKFLVKSKAREKLTVS